MRTIVVIDGTSADAVAAACRINGFVHAVGLADTVVDTVVVHDGEAAGAIAPALVATPDATTIRVPSHRPDRALNLLLDPVAAARAELVLFADDAFGRRAAVHVAAQTGGSALTEVGAITVVAEGLRCTRRVYAGHVEADFTLDRRPFCLTIAKGCARPLALAMGAPANPRRLDASQPLADDPIVSVVFCPEPEPANDLTRAETVMAIGRGAGSRAGTERLAAVAARLGATFAISRAVAMNGWAPFDRLVGLSGSIVRPQLCLVAGVSGAAAFVSGIEKSGFIVAVNRDADAPIFAIADVGVVGDCHAVLDALLAIVEAEPGDPSPLASGGVR